MSLQFHVRLASRSEEAVHHLSVYPILKVVLDREECSICLYSMIVVLCLLKALFTSQIAMMTPDFINTVF